MFRFTIRDVLWLTVVVGMGIGWWVDRWQVDDAWVQRFGNLGLELHKEGLTIFEEDDGSYTVGPLPAGAEYPR